MQCVFWYVCSGFTMCSVRTVAFILATRWLCKLLFWNNFFGVYFVFGGVSILRSPLRVSGIFHCLFQIDAFHRGRDDIRMATRVAQTQIILFVFWYVKYGWFCCCIQRYDCRYWVRSPDGSSIFELLTAARTQRGERACDMTVLIHFSATSVYV